MFNTLKQQQNLILAILVSIIAIVTIGYFVAIKKSEPMYRNPVDELMFNEKNKSPKYIITLPDKLSKKVNVAANKTTDAEQAKVESGLATQQRVLANVPILSKLTPIDDLRPLKNIDVDSSLIIKDGQYILPMKTDNNKPWLEYGTKVSVMPNFYRVAIVFKNFGLDKVSSAQIIKGLPSNISFSFSPYAQNQDEQIKDARKNGHETYIDLLLSSKSFLSVDTGPLAMNITASQEELINRMKQSLSVNAPIGGMIVNRGEAGVDSMERLEKILILLEKSGLLLVNGSGEETINMIKVPGLARVQANQVIDSDYTREDIRAKLEKAEKIARDNGVVIIVAEPKPVVVLEIKKWVDSFSPQLSYLEMRAKNISNPEKPFTLVPISNTVIE